MPSLKEAKYFSQGIINTKKLLNILGGKILMKIICIYEGVECNL